MERLRNQVTGQKKLRMIAKALTLKKKYGKLIAKVVFVKCSINK